MTNAFFPSPYVIAHIARTQDAGEISPDTGNPTQVSPAPVIRRAQAIRLEGRRASRQIISEEFVQRIDSEVEMAVADPQTYAPQDQVILFPELDENGEYLPDSGVAFWVDGLPAPESLSPWPGFFKVFGGSIKLKRVT